MSYVYTKEAYCKGCNKCIFKCPTNANEAFFNKDDGKVCIKDGFCISCGECLSICDHGARDYVDDTENFINAIKSGERISVVVAPSARFNFDETSKVLGYLKSLGVNKIYDVSLGADICTWAHVKMLKENIVDSIIAQPCPVVVSYIEKYRPELISKLSPIQSPAVCTSIYLKKYMGTEDKIMFFSPCIGKKRECKSTYTHNALDYNVTFDKFAEYIEKNNIDINSFPPTSFDNMQGSIGFTFSRPGGMGENIKFNLGQDVWIKQIEGIHNITKYFDEYIKDINWQRPVPTLVDALNCENGCNLGTGTLKNAHQNEIDYITNQNKTAIAKENADKLTEHFNSTLDIADFKRKYKDRSVDYQMRNDLDIEKAFISLGKITQTDRQINCFACGYGNCYDFAYNLAAGQNDKNNCRHYLLNKFKKLSLFDELTGAHNRNCYNLEIDKISINHPGFVGIIFIDINQLKEANDTYGHSYGDDLIITCAAILKKTFDASVYRVGGDEFVVLYQNNDENHFDKQHIALLELLSKEEKLRASVGHAKSFSSADLFDKIDEADQEMYTEKQNYYKNIGQADRRNRRSAKKL